MRLHQSHEAPAVAVNGDDSILFAIYEWPVFAPFVQEALGEVTSSTARTCEPTALVA